MRGLIFDFDGTLADTLPLCLAAFRAATEPLIGRPITDDEIRATFGPSEEGAVERLAPHAPEECLAAYLRHYDELHGMADAPFEGVFGILDLIHDRGLHLGLVTGKGPQTLAISMEKHGLARYFSEMRSGCRHGGCKPEMIQEILDVWGVSAHEVAYVGDNPHDTRDARLVGCIAIGAAWAPNTDHSRLVDSEPDHLFYGLDDFRAWLFTKSQI